MNGRSKQMGAVRNWPLAALLAIVLILGGLGLNARFGTPSNPDRTAVTANVPAKAEAQPKPKKREPQAGDVIPCKRVYAIPEGECPQLIADIALV
ncbi:MAG: hypothetical protein Q8M92_02075, partial [Candidatus Subteraquimicrobiales bacterium]|nr:hypothetical protein [Candidatus Subteraquimicrobiales bacterium]